MLDLPSDCFKAIDRVRNQRTLQGEPTTVASKSEVEPSVVTSAATDAAGPRRDSLQFGAILRDRRRALNLTLNDISERTGLAKGFLSDIERDKTSPSVASLVALCDALNLPVGDLFTPSKNVLVRADQRQPIKFGGIGVSDHLLTPSHGVRIQAIWSEIQPGGTAGDQLYSLRSEEEVVLVISGSILLNIEGEETVLGAGDTLTFDPRRPHSFRNPSQTEASTVVFIMTPPPA